MMIILIIIIMILKPRFVSGVRTTAYVAQPVGGIEATRLERFHFHLYVSDDCDAIVASLSSQLEQT